MVIKQSEKIIEYCEKFIDELPEEFFEKDISQNSEYGVGCYFKEKVHIGFLLWIGFTPPILERNPKFAFSVAVNTEKPLSFVESSYLQSTDSKEENWIYSPIDIDIETLNANECFEQFKQKAIKSLKEILHIALDTAIGF